VLLLDTHALLWWLDDQLPPGVSRTIANAEPVFVSAASLWEIEIKRALGKLSAPLDLIEQAEASHFVLLGMSAAHAVAAGRLPPHHSDPFDRMLVAQALDEQLTLVSNEQRLDAYGVARVWS
jgi:PIN domain nuclease of toxin-antitoxin system